MRKFFDRWSSTIAAGVMGVNLGVCGIHWSQWQYWVLFGTAGVWAALESRQGWLAQKG